MGDTPQHGSFGKTRTMAVTPGSNVEADRLGTKSGM